MNYQSLVASMLANTAKLTENEKENALNRNAVSAIPLAVGNVISFAPDASVMYQNINGTQIPMIVGVLADTFDASAEPTRISLVAFGRHFFNPQTKVLTKPIDIAEPGTDETKLTYTQFKELATLGEIPARLQGKTLKIRGIAQFESIDANGQARKQANGQSMFQTVYAFEFQ